jgi:hypothetical protein
VARLPTRLSARTSALAAALLVACDARYAIGRAPPPRPATVGIPPGTPLTPHPGDLQVATDGQVVDALDVAGCVQITGADVIIRRSRIRCPQHTGLPAISPGPNTVIEDCEIGPDSGEGPGSAIALSGYTLRRCDIHNCGDGARASANVLIEGNHLHHTFNLAPNEPGVGIYLLDPQGSLVIRDNRIEYAVPAAGSASASEAALFGFDNVSGANPATLLVAGNLLDASSIPLRLNDRWRSITFQGNRFRRSSSQPVLYSAEDAVGSPLAPTWSDNAFEDGEAIPAP